MGEKMENRMENHPVLDRGKKAQKRPGNGELGKFLRKSVCGPFFCLFAPVNQEPLNAPFLNGLFSTGFSRGKTAPQDEIGETPH